MNILINESERAPGQAIDGYVGEPLRILPPFVSVALPDGATLQQAGSQFTPTQTGWHEFETPVGVARVLVYEPAAADLVPEYQREGRATPRTLRERRLVLRSIAVHARIAGGTAADVRAVGDLSVYGA